MPNWRESPSADVISRVQRCIMAGCGNKAKWDVSTRNRRGEAGDWAPYCTPHARMMVAQAERNAETPTRVQGGE